MDSFDSRELCRRVVKYLLMGTIIAVCALVLPKQKLDFESIIALALVSGATFAIIDTFIPTMSFPLNFGVGFGLGSQLVGIGA